MRVAYTVVLALVCCSCVGYTFQMRVAYTANFIRVFL